MPLDTELHKSAHKGDLLSVEELVQSGEIDVNAPGAQDRTALHRAAGANHVNIINFLLQAGAPVDCVDRCLRTPLHWAAISGHLDATQLLLNSGADLRCKTVSGMNPLMCAVQQRWHSVADAILHWSAWTARENEVLPSPFELCSTPDAEGKTVRLLAKEGGDIPMQKLLKAYAPSKPPTSCCGGGAGGAKKQQLTAAVVPPRGESRPGDGPSTADISVSEREIGLGGVDGAVVADAAGGDGGSRAGEGGEGRGKRSGWMRAVSCLVPFGRCCGSPPVDGTQSGTPADATVTAAAPSAFSEEAGTAGGNAKEAKVSDGNRGANSTDSDGAGGASGAGDYNRKIYGGPSASADADHGNPFSYGGGGGALATNKSLASSGVKLPLSISPSAVALQSSDSCTGGDIALGTVPAGGQHAGAGSEGRGRAPRSGSARSVGPTTASAAGTDVRASAEGVATSAAAAGGDDKGGREEGRHRSRPKSGGRRSKERESGGGDGAKKPRRRRESSRGSSGAAASETQGGERRSRRSRGGTAGGDVSRVRGKDKEGGRTGGGHSDRAAGGHGGAGGGSGARSSKHESKRRSARRTASSEGVVRETTSQTMGVNALERSTNSTNSNANSANANGSNDNGIDGDSRVLTGSASGDAMAAATAGGGQEGGEEEERHSSVMKEVQQRAVEDALLSHPTTSLREASPLY